MRKSLTAVLLAAAVSMVTAAPASATHHRADGLIVFQAQTGDHIQLYTVRPDGQDLHQLTNLAGDSQAAEWSPDGRHIVFEFDAEDAGRIYEINVDGSGLRDLSPAGPDCCYGQPSFMSDGRRIVYESFDPLTSDDAIWIMRADGTGSRTLLEPWPRTGGTSDPIVSPNGRLLSVIGDDGSTKGPSPDFHDAQGLFVSRIDGSDFRQLMPFTSDQSLKHDWSPDGCRLLGAVNANWFLPDQSTNIFTIRPDGSGLRFLTHDQGGQAQQNAFAGSYSPDGRWIVFRQEDQGRYALERMRPDGSDIHIILPFSSTLLPRNSDWGSQRRQPRWHDGGCEAAR